MSHENTDCRIKELLDENDAASRRNIEGLAHSIDRFRNAVHHIAERHVGTDLTAIQLEQYSRKKQSVQRRVLMEWAVAAVLCVTMLVPALGYLRDRNLRLESQQQRQLQQQRQADEVLLENVSSEISETVPDSMQPLVLSGIEDANYQAGAQEMERNNVRK